MMELLTTSIPSLIIPSAPLTVSVKVIPRTSARFLKNLEHALSPRYETHPVLNTVQKRGRQQSCADMAKSG